MVEKEANNTMLPILFTCGNTYIITAAEKNVAIYYTFSLIYIY